MKLNIFTDGGARGNPGPAAAAYVILNDQGEFLEKCGKYLGKSTNNIAEYQAVILALGYLLKSGLAAKYKTIHFHSDSLLAVSQINGRWKIKDRNLRELSAKVNFMLAELANNFVPLSIKFLHIPRSKNYLADKLVNETLDQISLV